MVVIVVVGPCLSSSKNGPLPAKLPFVGDHRASRSWFRNHILNRQ
jgi:hypothetical protein